MKKLVSVLAVMVAVILVLSACSSAAPRTTPAPSAPALAYPSTLASPMISYPKPPITTAPSPATTIPDPQIIVTVPPTTSSIWPAPAATGTIGLAAGGAKDIANFRENIRSNYLPLPSDVTYEGLFYDYYFNTGVVEPTNKLFSPSYSLVVSRDLLSGQPEYYLSVGLNSGMKESDFQRKN